MTEKKFFQWHPAFYHAMRLELRNEKGLEFIDEFELTRKPLKIDLMIVQKEADIVINNTIGKIFKAHNIIEYKSPKDDMNIRTFYKAIAYACLYIISPIHNIQVDARDITITLLRHSKPRKLLDILSDGGYLIEHTYKGIYYIKGSMFEVQIIVSSELDTSEYKWITALSDNIQQTQYLDLYHERDDNLNENEKGLADTVIQLVTSVNEESVRKWKEGKNMCQALREIMKPEIDAAVQEAIQEGELKGTIKTYFKCKKTPQEIVELTDCSLDYIMEVLGL